jgi:hypothetical protein
VRAQHILAAAAAIFVIVALVGRARHERFTAQTRTWLIVAAIFAIVSAWLSWRA